jgi:FMN phosphatase YigB (HAD superfamily)
MSFQELLAAKHPTAWLDFERGALDESAFFASFFADGRAVDGPGLRAAMRAAYAFVPGMEALLSRLHAAGYELHAFSNYPDWWRLVEERLALSRFLSWSAVSCLPAMRGARKPEPEAFLAAAAAAGGEAAHLVLIVRARALTGAAGRGATLTRRRACPGAQDDREVNVNAARAAGWAAVHFTGSADKLEAELALLGVRC